MKIAKAANGEALVEIVKKLCGEPFNLYRGSPVSKSREIRICSSPRPFPLGSRDNLSCSNMSTRAVQLLLQVSHSTC